MEFDEEWLGFKFDVFFCIICIFWERNVYLKYDIMKILEYLGICYLILVVGVVMCIFFFVVVFWLFEIL